MKRESRTVDRSDQVDSPSQRHLPLVDLLVDMRAELMELRAIVVRAYKQTDVATARRLLQDLARRLEDRYPSAAASVREGLDETLTVITLGLSERLRQSLATTNAIESRSVARGM